MSKTKKDAATTGEEEEEIKLPPDQTILKKWLDTKKDFHYNFETFRGDYKVSSGSKILDEVIGGGFSSGLIRFTGATESGKTAEALEVQRNFLKQVPISKAIFVKAEGRLSDEMKARTDVKFVFSAEEWEIGTCFVFECNIYEVVFDLLRLLILDKANQIRYHIIIDSMDGLLPETALAKSTGQAAQVAAGAVMTSDFLKRTNLGLSKRGHMCIMMAQIRTEIRADQYTPKDKNKLGGASGGNAAVHMPDWVFEFLRPKSEDFILLKDAAISVTNKPVGRVVNLKIWKSTNETTMIPVSYPIRFGRKLRSAIWVEREVIEILIQWGFIIKKGSWFSFDEELAAVMGEFKIQGLEKLYDYAEENKEFFEKLLTFADEKVFSKIF